MYEVCGVDSPLSSSTTGDRGLSPSPRRDSPLRGSKIRKNTFFVSACHIHGGVVAPGAMTVIVSAMRAKSAGLACLCFASHSDFLCSASLISVDVIAAVSSFNFVPRVGYSALVSDNEHQTYAASRSRDTPRPCWYREHRFACAPEYPCSAALVNHMAAIDSSAVTPSPFK